MQAVQRLARCAALRLIRSSSVYTEHSLLSPCWLDAANQERAKVRGGATMTIVMWLLRNYLY